MKTKVQFRAFPNDPCRGSAVVALFPEIPYDRLGIYCSSYQSTGQHGAADPYLARRTRPATLEEIAPLSLELRRIGYRLEVVRRVTSAMHKVRYAEAAKAALRGSGKA